MQVITLILVFWTLSNIYLKYVCLQVYDYNFVQYVNSVTK